MNWSAKPGTSVRFAHGPHNCPNMSKESLYRITGGAILVASTLAGCRFEVGNGVNGVAGSAHTDKNGVDVNLGSTVNGHGFVGSVAIEKPLQGGGGSVYFGEIRSRIIKNNVEESIYTPLVQEHRDW